MTRSPIVCTGPASRATLTEGTRLFRSKIHLWSIFFSGDSRWQSNRLALPMCVRVCVYARACAR